MHDASTAHSGPRTRPGARLGVAIALLLACNEDSGKTSEATSESVVPTPSTDSAVTSPEPTTGTTGADPSFGTSGTTGAVGPCADFMGLASPEELAKTPRADPNAELLALEMSAGAFLAPDPLYDRISAELAAIRAKQPAVVGLNAMSYLSMRSFDVKFEPEAAPTDLDDYDGWDCANAYYEIEPRLYSNPYASLFYDGLYDTDALAAQYSGLPGVASASPSLPGGDGDDICLEIVGTDHAYIFMKGGGDCPAGCNENQYWAFRVDAATNVTDLGFWDNTQGDPPPGWWAQLADCRERL